MILRKESPGAVYADTSGKSSVLVSTSRQNRGMLSGLMTFMAVFFVVVASVAGGLSAEYRRQQVEAIDWTQWLMCEVLPESAKEVYQYANSKDLQFNLRSKSAVTSGIDDVDQGLNWLLEGTGSDFKTVNEAILGYSLYPQAAATPEEQKQKEEKDKQNQQQGQQQDSGTKGVPNGGNYVNPYDRFGVAGLNFSGYQGEWKYFVIDACKKDGEPSDPKAGLFYQTRLEPRSGWEDIGNSKDVRTKQFSANPTYPIVAASFNTIANMIFSITKIIVTLTIAFINFSLTDVVTTLGLDSVIGGKSGVFTSLFNGVFTPLVAFAFIATACWIFWIGVVKKQYRESVTGVARSIAMFCLAIIISLNPLQYITIPNNAAVILEAAILSSMNSNLLGGSDMCATDVGQVNSNLLVSKGKDEQGQLDEAAQNIKSVIGCKLWQNLLFKPWTEGQFGTDYNNLWANGKKADWAPEGAQELGNANDEMVGHADVPLGANKTINNWGVYQVSAQTSAHAVTDGDGKKMVPVNGVAPDWYRIVDALSNYDEEEVSEDTQVNKSGATEAVKYKAPKEANKPLAYWDTWVGNSIGSRYTSSLSSILIALIACASLILLGGLTAVYTLGMTIAMAFAPIFLLLGCWAGIGWNIFKGYAGMVWQTFSSRVMSTLLLIFNVILVSNILDMASTISWGKMVTLLMILTVAIFKGRNKIINAFSTVNFGGADLSTTAKAAFRKTADITMAPLKTSGRFASSALGGGFGARKAGGTFTRGIGAGIGQEISNLAYRSKGLRHLKTTYDEQATALGKNNPLAGEKYCAKCGKKLDYEMDERGTEMFIGGRDGNGNLICRQCLEDINDPDVDEVKFPRPTERKIKDMKREKDKQRMRIADAYRKRFSYKSAYGEEFAYTTDAVLQNAKEGRRQQGEAELRRMMAVVKNDINEHENAVLAKNYAEFDNPNRKKPDKIENARTTITAEIPKEIERYVDKNALQAAWASQNYDYVLMTYVAAWVVWYQENTGQKYSADLDETFKAVKESKLDSFDRAELKRFAEMKSKENDESSSDLDKRKSDDE